jgi:hypothetical protein
VPSIFYDNSKTYRFIFKIEGTSTSTQNKILSESLISAKGLKRVLTFKCMLISTHQSRQIDDIRFFENFWLPI